MSAIQSNSGGNHAKRAAFSHRVVALLKVPYLAPAFLFIGSYELNKEKVTQGRSGAKVCTVSLRNKGSQDGVVITTSMPTAQGQMHLVETRQLLDKGHVHAQVRGSVAKAKT